MSKHDQIILTLWLIIAIGSPVWMYLQIRKQDKKEEEREAKQIELDADWDEYLDQLAAKYNKGPVFDLAKGKEVGYQDRARRAEELGFIDPDHAA